MEQKVALAAYFSIPSNLRPTVSNNFRLTFNTVMRTRGSTGIRNYYAHLNSQRIRQCPYVNHIVTEVPNLIANTHTAYTALSNELLSDHVNGDTYFARAYRRILRDTLAERRRVRVQVPILDFTDAAYLRAGYTQLGEVLLRHAADYLGVENLVKEIAKITLEADVQSAKLNRVISSQVNLYPYEGSDFCVTASICNHIYSLSTIRDSLSDYNIATTHFHSRFLGGLSGRLILNPFGYVGRATYSGYCDGNLGTVHYVRSGEYSALFNLVDQFVSNRRDKHSSEGDIRHYNNLSRLFNNRLFSFENFMRYQGQRMQEQDSSVNQRIEVRVEAVSLEEASNFIQQNNIPQVAAVVDPTPVGATPEARQEEVIVNPTPVGTGTNNPPSAPAVPIIPGTLQVIGCTLHDNNILSFRVYNTEGFNDINALTRGYIGLFSRTVRYSSPANMGRTLYSTVSDEQLREIEHSQDLSAIVNVINGLSNNYNNALVFSIGGVVMRGFPMLARYTMNDTMEQIIEQMIPNVVYVMDTTFEHALNVLRANSPAAEDNAAPAVATAAVPAVEPAVAPAIAQEQPQNIFSEGILQALNQLGERLSNQIISEVNTRLNLIIQQKTRAEPTLSHEHPAAVGRGEGNHPNLLHIAEARTIRPLEEGRVEAAERVEAARDIRRPPVEAQDRTYEGGFLP